MKFNEDSNTVRYIDLFPVGIEQINVAIARSTKHIAGLHRHFWEDYLFCPKGGFKVCIIGKDDEPTWFYLTDKVMSVLRVPGNAYHGYRALEPNSIMVYGFTNKYIHELVEKVPSGFFGEEWE